MPACISELPTITPGYCVPVLAFCMPLYPFSPFVLAYLSVHCQTAFGVTPPEYSLLYADAHSQNYSAFFVTIETLNRDLRSALYLFLSNCLNIASLPPDVSPTTLCI